MASVNFMKLHTSQNVKDVIRHCDKEERKNHNHSNTDIQKNLTDTNIQMDRDYKKTCYLYDEVIKELDSKEGANKRKDRVTAFGLDVPFPASLPQKKQGEITNKIIKIIKNQYPESVLLNAYLHRDEIHDYKDAETGKQRTSLAHTHFIVMPIKDDKLNGKWFSSKANMKKLNGAIHDMYQRDYGIQFMDGSKAKSKKSVERLKSESYTKEQEQKLKELDNKSQYLDDMIIKHKNKAKKLDEREKGIDDKETVLNDRISDFNSRSLVLQREEREMALNRQIIDEKADVIDYMENHTMPGDKRNRSVMTYVKDLMATEKALQKLNSVNNNSCNTNCGMDKNSDDDFSWLVE